MAAKPQKQSVFTVYVTVEKNFSSKPGDRATNELRKLAIDTLKGMSGWESDVGTVRAAEKAEGGTLFQQATGKLTFSLRHSEDVSLQVLSLKATRIVGYCIVAAQKKGIGWSITAAKDALGNSFDLDAAKHVVTNAQYETAHIQLPPKWEPFFTGIFGLNPQIRLTWDSLQGFIRSNYTERTHGVYYGKPGCGKTTVSRRFCDVIREHSPPGAVLELTASQVTKAGIERYLVEVDPKPSLIFLEEVDKVRNEDNFTCLLDICNEHGFIRRLNASDGNKVIPINALVWCTVNNVARFRNMLGTALASRFPNKIFFPRPSEQVLRQIAGVKVKKIKGGSVAWINPAIALMKQYNLTDPRSLVGILSGGSRLIDGSYQADLEAITKALHAESTSMIEEEKSRTAVHDSLNFGE